MQSFIYNDANFTTCMQTASNYSTLLGTLCSDTGDACTTAQANLVMDATCITDDRDVLCTGTCRDLFDAIIISCNAKVSHFKPIANIILAKTPIM